MFRSFMLKSCAKAVLFLFCCLLIVMGLSALLTPSFEPQRTTIRGMYEQPRGSVEVVALGGSTLLDGFSPMRLYDKHGISSYNCCSFNQSPLISYWLLKEMLRLQGDSISLVVFDATALARETKKLSMSSYAERVSNQMPLSPVKIGFTRDMARELSGATWLEYLVPVLRFHSRWPSLNEDDFESLTTKTYSTFGHGQRTQAASNLTNGTAGKYTDSKNQAITAEYSFSKKKLAAVWNKKSLEYFDKIIDLCRENDIDILMMKTAWSKWGDKEHDSISLLAKRRDIPFVDLSEPDIWKSCGMSYDTDYKDEKHPNVLGSLKISDWLGDYLEEHYDLRDVREDAISSRMNEDLARFNSTVENAQLPLTRNLNDYLTLLDNQGLDIFISVKGEAADSLDDNTRKQMEDLGFTELSKLGSQSSYVGVRNNGEVVLEVLQQDGEAVTAKGSYHSGKVVFCPGHSTAAANEKHALVMTSTGADNGSSAEISIKGKNQSENKQGLNIVVCDHETGDILDTAAFDTHVGLNRVTDLPKKAD